MSKVVDTLVNALNPNAANPGKTLLILNALGMAFAALSNTFAAAKDKNTSADDKKFLIPAGLITGVANIGIYFAMTDKLIKKFGKKAEEAVKEMNPKYLLEKTTQFVNKEIAKNEKGFLGTSLFKKTPEYIDSMKANLLQNGVPTDKSKELFKNNLKGGAGVVGAFVGAIIGCSIITPIIRDISAYVVQKKIEKKNPSMQEKAYLPYFDPTHVGMGPHKNNFNKLPKQTLTMKNYLTFAHGRMKV